MEQTEKLFGKMLTRIQLETRGARNIARRIPQPFIEELLNYHPLFYGDYQARLREQFGNSAVDFPRQTAIYIQELLTEVDSPILCVDFGSGAARSSCRAACEMAGFISAGRVKILATNISSAPTSEEMDSPDLRSRLHPDHKTDLKRVLKENLVEFIPADIVELYQRLQPDSVYLMFNIDTLAATYDYNDMVLTAIAQLLNSRFGSVVLGFPDWRTQTQEISNLLLNGLKTLQNSGFRNKGNPVDPLTRSVAVFQAPESPNFPLVKG